MPALRGAAVVLLFVSVGACREHDAAGGITSADQVTATASVAGPLSTSGSGDQWSPPYLLEFVGYALDNVVHHVNSGPDAVYWMTDRYKIWRGGLELGPESSQVYECYNCLREMGVGGTQLFLLRQSTLIQVDSATGAETITETPISHTSSGAVVVDVNFVYSIPIGCGGVGRYARPSLTAETVVTGAARTTAAGGVTLRLRSNGGILVSCANSITVLDEWSAAPRNIADPVDGLWSSDVSVDWIYWIERNLEGKAVVGVVPWQGDKPAQMYPLPESGGDYRDACVLPGTELFLIPRMKTLDVFDGETRSFKDSIQLEGRPHSVHCTQDAVYASVEGMRERPGFQGVDTIASWIARIPREMLAP